MTYDPRQTWDRDMESLEDDSPGSWRVERVDDVEDEIDWVFHDLRPSQLAPAETPSVPR